VLIKIIYSNKYIGIRLELENYFIRKYFSKKMNKSFGFSKECSIIVTHFGGKVVLLPPTLTIA